MQRAFLVGSMHACIIVLRSSAVPTVMAWTWTGSNGGLGHCSGYDGAAMVD